MNLIHISTERFYSSAVLVAIVLLAIPDGYLCYWKPPLSYTFGSPKPGDHKDSRHLKLPASYKGVATLKATLNLRWQINYIKFVDNAHNGPKIWLSKWPPCYNPEFEITSANKERIDVTMEFSFARP